MVNNKNKKQTHDKLSANSLEDAIKKIKELSALKKRKFIESIDLAVNLGIDAKQSDQSVKGSILLPNGSGKKIKVIVFTGNEELQKIANDSGALMSGLDDLILKIDGGFLDFDCCIATPDVMQKISKVAKKLGPRGLMPSPKNGTVTNDIKKALSDAIKGKADFKNDKGGTVHCLIGKVNFETEHLLENVRAVIKAIKDAKPENAKGKYIKAFYLNSTMGPSIEVSVESI
ncbi:MAG: 50S ribosomal protein L1 [Alphaproteobacteria bacterium]|nr:50S ribosomal protein L1 [Alphaproteobacteria bacterium]